MAVIFKKLASTVQNWNKKRGKNLSFWRSHSYVDRYLKKKVFTLFPIRVRPAASTAFPNLALRVKSLPTPGISL